MNLEDLGLTKIRMATDADNHLPSFDYTKLTALNTCPRWGLVRYDQHKVMPGEGRAMPLELGSAAHDCFAAVRLYELLVHGPSIYGDEVLTAAYAHGKKLFGADRFLEMMKFLNSNEDANTQLRSFVISCAESSGFYDDPEDRRRTMSNLINSLMAYIDRIEVGTRIPYFNADTGVIGIETPINLVVSFSDGILVRFVGRMDGLTWNSNRTKLAVEENKTASRLDRSWQDSFILNHQPTGYCVAASTITGIEVEDAIIRGMMVPLPKTYDLGGIVNLPVDRDNLRKLEWLRWVHQTLTTQYFPYKDDFLNAPEYTHSCNRYFRSCAFIPLCAMAEPEERELTFSQMITSEWSPLHERNDG